MPSLPVTDLESLVGQADKALVKGEGLLEAATDMPATGFTSVDSSRFTQWHVVCVRLFESAGRGFEAYRNLFGTRVTRAFGDDVERGMGVLRGFRDEVDAQLRAARGFSGADELEALEGELGEVLRLDAKVAELLGRVGNTSDIPEELRREAISVAVEVGAARAAQSFGKRYADADFTGVLRGLRGTLLDRRQDALEAASDEGLAWLVLSSLYRREQESGISAASGLLEVASSCGFGDNETLHRAERALVDGGMAAIVGDGNDRMISLTSDGRDRLRQRRYGSGRRPVIESFEPTGGRTLDESHSPRTVVVLTALDVEFDAVLELLDSPRRERHPHGTRYMVGDSKGWKVAIVEAGTGDSRASLETERAIQHFSPELVVFLGVAGGIKDVSIGDVVVATKVYGYESGKDGSEFRPRPDVGEPSYRALQAARAVAGDLRRNGTRFRVFLKPIAAGEKVVASHDSETARFIRSNYGDAVAVEMEGRGFLVAASAREGVKYAVVRGISDLLDRKAESDADGSQERASANAASVLACLLDELVHDEPGLGPQ